MSRIITYDNDTFKCIDCIPEYSDYHSIYVAKNPHVDENGRQYQIVNTCWGKEKINHAIYDHPLNNGYLQVNLPPINGGNPRYAKVHRLVILTWLDLPANYNKLQVNHRNEVKNDNRLENLELVTCKDNCVWATRLQRIRQTKIRTGQTVKAVAINIRTRRTYRFDTIADCARKLNLNPGHVCECIKGRLKQTGGYVCCREDEYSETKIGNLIANAARR